MRRFLGQGGFLLSLALPEDDRNFDDKADILDINGFREEWQFALRAGRPPETGLLAFLRLMNCGGELAQCFQKPC